MVFLFLLNFYLFSSDPLLHTDPVEVDDTTSFPIRLSVIDGDGLPVIVDMYREGDHYLFIPVAPNGTRLIKNPNLEDPDPELGRILARQYSMKERSRWVEPEENLERRKAVTGGTNIDTPRGVVGKEDDDESPSRSRGLSFNQSAFKQTDSSTLPPRSRSVMKKEWRNVDSHSPYRPQNDDGDGGGGGNFFRDGGTTSSDDETEFHLQPENPNTISFLFDKNKNDEANTGGGESSLEHSSSTSPLSPISPRIMLDERKMLQGGSEHQSDLELKPPSPKISMSSAKIPSSEKILFNGSTESPHHQSHTPASGEEPNSTTSNGKIRFPVASDGDEDDGAASYPLRHLSTIESHRVEKVSPRNSNSIKNYTRVKSGRSFKKATKNITLEGTWQKSYV
ncbi:uncharacterized protein LOC118434838 [Folsomia candida]|uniref:uncharacterized protein LOC118434838 n=1 Tax=Folsomia candida TaxID=158441 RepID=UPI001605123A|nr:uncharacterized protein LOC118434838 [Folsomia candida]